MASLPQYATDGRSINRRRLGPALIAPMPSDPTRCRWCGGTLRALLEGEPVDHCSMGCATNDQAPYMSDCTGCRREFKTGRHRATTCADCDQAERRDTAAIARTIPRHEMHIDRDYSSVSGRRRR